MRITCFATNTPDRPIAEPEFRHRLRARAEDRIRTARTTGLRNPPLHHTAPNRVWLEIARIALDLPAWMPMLALTSTAGLREPRCLQVRLFSAAGQLPTTGPGAASSASPGTGPGPARSPPRSDDLHSCPTPADQPRAPARQQQHPPRAGEPGTHPTRSRATDLPTISAGKRKGPPTPSADPHERSRLRLSRKLWSSEVRRSAGGGSRSAPSIRRGTKRRRTARTTSSSLDELDDLWGDFPRGHDDGAMVEPGQSAAVGLRQDLGDCQGRAPERGRTLATG